MPPQLSVANLPTTSTTPVAPAALLGGLLAIAGCTTAHAAEHPVLPPAPLEAYVARFIGQLLRQAAGRPVAARAQR